jgi:hypothetical protein
MELGSIHPIYPANISSTKRETDKPTLVTRDLNNLSDPFSPPFKSPIRPVARAKRMAIINTITKKFTGAPILNKLNLIN